MLDTLTLAVIVLGSLGAMTAIVMAMWHAGCLVRLGHGRLLVFDFSFLFDTARQPAAARRHVAAMWWWFRGFFGCIAVMLLAALAS